MIKLRYIFGVPLMFMLAMKGQNVLFDALIIGVLAGLTDMNNDRMRPS